MTKYLIIFSHGIVKFHEFVFCCSLQPKLSIGKVYSFLSSMYPLYLGFLELLYRCIMSLSLGINAILE